jgi:hypothetical protein
MNTATATSVLECKLTPALVRPALRCAEHADPMGCEKAANGQHEWQSDEFGIGCKLCRCDYDPVAHGGIAGSTLGDDQEQHRQLGAMFVGIVDTLNEIAEAGQQANEHIEQLTEIDDAGFAQQLVAGDRVALRQIVDFERQCGAIRNFYSEMAVRAGVILGTLLDAGVISKGNAKSESTQWEAKQ